MIGWAFERTGARQAGQGVTKINVTTGASNLPLLAMCAAVMIWGVFWMPLRWLDGHGLHGAWVTFAITLASTLATLLIVGAGRMTRPAVDRRLVLIGLAFGGSFACYFTGILFTPIVKALVLYYMTPLWGTLFGIWLLGERLTLHRCAAMIACAIGLVVVLSGGLDSFPLPENLGDWLALAGGVLWSYGTVLLVLQNGVPVIYQCLSMFIGGAALSGLAILLLPVEVAGAMPDVPALLDFLPGLAGFVLIMFVPSNIFAAWGSGFLSPGFVGLLLPAEIVIGIVTVSAFSGDPITERQAIGAALIIGGTLADALGGMLARRRAVPA
jgi:drug/metabolite transporter (DMT)-like permease